MKKKFLLVIIFLLFQIPTVGFSENISSKELFAVEAVLWQKTLLLKQGANNLKIHNIDPLIFGYFENQQWIVRNEEKELFRSSNDNVKVYDTNPRYISYLTKKDVYEELILQTLIGEKVELPKTTKAIELIQKTKFDEVYIQYWLKSNSPKEIRGLGTVIKSNGEEIFPLGYYFYFSKNGIHDNNRYSIMKEDTNFVLFYNNSEILESKRIKTNESIEENRNYIIIQKQNQEYLYNVKTGWESKKFNSIPFFRKNLIIANLDGDDFSNNGLFKFFKVENDTLTDISPTPTEINLFIPVRTHNNDNSFSFFIREKKSSKIKNFRWLNNKEWDSPEEIFINLDNMDINILSSLWYEDKKTYHLFGNINYKNVTMFYDNKTKTLLKNLSGSNSDASLFYVFYTNFDEEKNYNKLLYFTIVNQQGEILFEKKQLEDGFINKEATQFFYKTEDFWEVFNIENKTNFLLPDIVELKTNKISDVAFYRTTAGEKGIFVLNNNMIIPLPQEINVKDFLYGSSKEKSIILKVQKNKQIQLLKLNWQYN